jgi:hypothetical protein
MTKRHWDVLHDLMLLASAGLVGLGVGWLLWS